MPRTIHSSRRLLVAFALVFAMLVTFPLTALARSYDIGQVNIQATVEADGTVSVFETRTFDFDGDYHGVYWNLPKGDFNGREIEPTNIAVGIAPDADGGSDQAGLQSFTSASTGQDGTYMLSDYGDYDQVKLYSAHSDESVTFYVSYDLPQLATRWADTSELYWKYVSDGWDVDSNNVTCILNLPVPSGEQISAGDNVRAWGHGPLDGTVSFDADAGQVIFTSPTVSSSEYAELRVCFPASWLSAATSVNTEDADRLEEVVDEEQRLSDEANAQRLRARLMLGGGLLAAAVLAAATLAVTLGHLRRYRRQHAAAFDDEYFRDVPSADHPAIIGSLVHGKAGSEELTGALMRLTDEKMAKLEPVTLSSGALIHRRAKKDWRLTLLRQDLLDPAPPVAKQDYIDAIDRATARFAFRDVARRSAHVRDDAGAPTLYFSDVKKVAEKYQEEYAKAYESWTSRVDACAEERDFYVDPNHVSKSPLIALGVADELVAILLLAFGLATVASAGSFGSYTALLTAVLIACVAAGIFAFAQSRKLQDLSPEAVEIKAKTVALKRWLCDFTRLKEAVPQDIILWNRLLVMAVVLGVSKEVVDQLKVACPQFFDESGDFGALGGYYFSSYIWFASGGPVQGGLPAETFSSALSSAVHVATSSNSSGFGGGGGFSGGGGGGFGGGGGGGAF